jgi:hypothetical protein
MTKELRRTVPTADWFVSSGCMDCIRSITIQYIGLVFQMDGWLPSFYDLYLNLHPRAYEPVDPFD